MSGFLKGIFSSKDATEGNPSEEWGEDVTFSEAQDNDQRAQSGLAYNSGQDQTMKKRDRKPTQAPIVRPFELGEVWKARDVNVREQQTVQKAQDLLGALPSSIPHDAKRQVVEASLKAFEISIEEIVSSASHEIEALGVFIGTTNSEAAEFEGESKERIAALEAEIDNIRHTMEKADAETKQVIGAANAVIDQVTPILDFFESPVKPSGPMSEKAETSESRPMSAAEPLEGAPASPPTPTPPTQA